MGRSIRRIRQSKGMTESQLAKLLNSHQSNINRIENGKQGYSIDFLLRMSKALGVPPYDFFSDEPLVAKGDFEKSPLILEHFPDKLTKEDFSKYRTQDDFLPIRILEDAASLGHGAVVSQERTKGYALIYKSALPSKAKRQTREKEKILCLFAKGDSMTPTIQDKSLVAIDLEDRLEITNYRIYAVEIPDEGVTIKRVYKADHELILMADNREFSGFPRCLHLDRLDYNPICGRVVWAWSVL